MSIAAVLTPVFLQVLLTFALLFRLGMVRAAALRQGGIDLDDVRLNGRAWPKLPLQVSSSFDNQFQIPVLFYAITALELITHATDIFFVVLAWIFVVSRYVHAGIHITSNRVKFRFRAYSVGVAALILAWLLFAFKVYTGA
ncbi:MAPEG family protein [Labrys sp. La1]|uniref:MAPEG family protein n=1 Tax=Labrys sp. La1 TaxID=3404917 RepID=UPI003EB91F85